jgi:hypothetical protein
VRLRFYSDPSIIIQSHPAEGIADVLRELRDAAVNRERSSRCVYGPTNQMRMSKQAHGFNPDADGQERFAGGASGERRLRNE